MADMTLKQQMELMLLISQEMGHRRTKAVEKFRQVTKSSVLYANNLWNQMQNEVAASDGFGGRVVRYLDMVEDAVITSLEQAKSTGSFTEFVDVAGRMEAALGLGAKANVTFNQTNTQVNNLAAQLAGMSVEELRSLAQPEPQRLSDGGSAPRIGTSNEGRPFVDVQAEPRGSDCILGIPQA